MGRDALRRHPALRPPADAMGWVRSRRCPGAGDAGTFHGLKQNRTVLGGHCHQRKAEFVLTEAERGHGGLDRDRIGLQKKRPHQGEQPIMQGARLVGFAGKRQFREFGDLARGDIGRGGNE